MPRPITLTRRFKDGPPDERYPIETIVATEAELLEFANKLRAAGDADPIESLMPSKPGAAGECLIANALNFSSRVDTWGREWEDGSLKWKIMFPENMPAERVREIAASVGLEPNPPSYEVPVPRRAFLLPQHIGNAAHAFDSGDGFQEYAR